MRPLLASLVCLLQLPCAAAAQDSYGATARVAAQVHPEPVATSDYRINVHELRRVPRADSQSLLTLVPGFLLTNHGGEGHTSTMYLRGYDAGEGQGIEFTLDGIPLNEVGNHHSHGYVDTTFIMPEVVRELRVVEGPFDPAQGDFAVAGSAEYSLGLAEPGIQASYGYGSFRRQRALLAWRPSGERARTFASVGFLRGDGFGINRAFSQANAVGQYEAQVSKGTRLRTLFFAAAQRWDSAGVIREDDYQARALPCPRNRDAQFFCTYDPNQGGSGQRAGLTTILERTSPSAYHRAQAFVTLRDLRTRENFTGFLLDPVTDGSPQRGDLRDGRTQAVTVGARALSRFQGQLWGRLQSLELGMYARQDVLSTSMERVRRELRVPYLTDFDRSVRQTNLAIYVRTDLRPVDRLRLTLGARADAFAFDVLDKNLPSEDRIGPRLPHESVDAYGFALAPRTTVDVRLVEGLHSRTSFGLGQRSSDAAALSQAEASPFARFASLETGLAYDAWLGRAQLDARSAVFATRISRDLLFDPEAGRNETIGASNRSGWLVSLQTRVPRMLVASASASYTRAQLSSPGDAIFRVTGGEPLPFVPTWLLRGDLVLEHSLLPDGSLTGFTSAGLTYVGQRALPQGAWARPYAVADVALGARYRVVELSASVTNLFGVFYRQAELNYASNFEGPSAPRSSFPARHFSAGAPRQFLLTVSVQLDPSTLSGGET